MAEFKKECSKVEYHRLTRGMSRAALARAAGVSDNVIRRMETGKGYSGIALSSLHKVSRALGVPLEEIIEHDYLEVTTEDGEGAKE